MAFFEFGFFPRFMADVWGDCVRGTCDRSSPLPYLQTKRKKIAHLNRSDPQAGIPWWAGRTAADSTAESSRTDTDA